MLRPLFSSCILLNLLYQINSLHCTDWTYNCETQKVTLKSNGNVYACPISYILESIRYRNTEDLCPDYSTNPSCVKARLTRKSDKPCDNVPTPTAEDILETVEKVYRSSSIDDNAATKEWYDQLLQNLTQIENHCRENRIEMLQSEKVESARKTAQTAYDYGRNLLPLLWANASYAQDLLEQALKKNDGVYVRNLSATFDSETRDREQLFMKELNALNACDEYGFDFWKGVAEMRDEFVQKMSLNYRMETVPTPVAQRFVENRMDLLAKMAKASKALALIRLYVEDVAYDMADVCPPSDYYDELEN